MFHRLLSATLSYRRSLLVGVACLGAALRADAECYRMNLVAQALDDDVKGLQVVLHTATPTAQGLALRLGIFNPTDKPITSDLKLSVDDVLLVSFGRGSRFQTPAATSSLKAFCPDGRLNPKCVSNGELTFAISEDRAPSDMGTMTLRVAHFAPLSFSLDKDRAFQPVDFAAMESRSPLNMDVVSQSENLAMFTLRLASVVVKEDALEVVLGFKNSSRFPVSWRGGLDGSMSRLITAHGDVAAPISVSDSLKTRIAPPGKEWASGEDNIGWIRFPLPSPTAAEEMVFQFAGYPPIRLTLNKTERVWQPAVKAQAAHAPASKGEAVRDEEHHFADVKSFWAAATNDLAKARFTSFLNRFTGEALSDQRISVAAWSKLPVTSVELSVPEFQRIQPNAKGLVKDVRVLMKYTLATLQQDNVFIANMECDMRRDQEDRWTVEDVRYPKMQPFWLLGYTAATQSAHFTIFHRDKPESKKEVDLAAQQLEKSYGRLLKAGLPLSPHNAAFLVATKPDFEKLTDRSADNYSGVASSAYQVRDGRIYVVNKAMYINDYRFFTLQRAWGKQDRQVAIQHEMTHLALAEQTRPWTPAWLVEGLAMLYAEQCDSFTRDALARVLPPTLTIPVLSKLPRLGSDTDNAIRLMTEYQLSGEAVRWLIKKRGLAAVHQFYQACATALPEDMTALTDKGKAGMDARLKFTRKVFDRFFPDLSLEELDQQVRKVVKG